MLEKIKSNVKKATVIPALCVLASLTPTNAKANWAAGIGYLISGIVSGTGTAIASRLYQNSTQKTVTPVHTKATEPAVYHTPVVEEKTVPETSQPVYVITHEQQQLPAQPKRYTIHRRVVSERVIERPGQDPIIETVIEEIPVQIPQSQPVRYSANQGR